MFTLFHFWIDSLRLFAPAQTISVLQTTVRIFARVFKMVVLNLKWFFVTDLLLFVFLGAKIVEMLQVQDDAILKAHPSTLFFYVVTGVIWFIVNSVFLLFIRKEEDDRAPMNYFRIYFFRYIQLSLFFSLLLFLLITLLMACSISKIPTPHWSVVCIVRLLELITLFYWLDSDFSLKQIFIALEKSINFIVYNLPIFVFIVTMMWLSEALIKGLVFGWGHAFTVDQALLGGKAEQALKGFQGGFTAASFTLFKYGKFIIEFFWITLLFVVYSLKKQISYTKSFFE